VPCGLQPLARREVFRTEVLKDADLSVIELTDEQTHFAVAVKVGPTGCRVTRAFHADCDAARLETNRRFEVGSAAERSAGPEQECQEHESLHGTILRRENGRCITDEP